MKYPLFSFAALLLTCLPATAQTTPEGPTMGWSSWNTYGANINATLIQQQAAAMAGKGLKEAGYLYVNIDDGFQGKDPDVGRDAEGNLIVNPKRFPKGLKPVADYIHSKGLRAGIYSDAGRNTCAHYYGGQKQEKGVGLYEHDAQDCKFYFNDCGFDFIKVDYCGADGVQNTEKLGLNEQKRYTEISQAIKATGRDVRFNICRWHYPGTWVSNVSTSWRTTPDINCSWGSVKGIIAENLYMSAYSSYGHYNDMDMLEVGRTLTSEEDKTHFGMWCMLNSPLLIGCDLRNIKSTTLTLLKNRDLIAINQDMLGQQAYPVKYLDGCYLLVRDVETFYGLKRVFAVYNPTDEPKTVNVSFHDLCLAGQIRLRDLFRQKDLEATDAETFEVNIPRHGTRIYAAIGERRLEQTRYEAEAAYNSVYQEIYNNQAIKSAVYSADAACSAGYKAGWLGGRKENDLLFRHVHSSDGGEYRLTIAGISGENRNISIEVNGRSVRTISCNSGGWGTVKRFTPVTVTLLPGDNEIRLSNASSWMPDIDYIDVEPTHPTAIGVPAVSTAMESAGNSTAYSTLGVMLPTPPEEGIYIQNGAKILKR